MPKARDFAQPREKPSHSARSYAVWMLGRREYSAQELKKKLVARGYSEIEAAEAMDYVIANRLQSDERYAGMKARSVQHRSGNMRISMALKSKGVGEDLVKDQIAALSPEDERAIAMASNKFGATCVEQGLTPALRQKIYRFLGYRGFSAKSIRAATDALRPIS